MEYKVVTESLREGGLFSKSGNINTFIEMVNAELAAGWKPQGGIQVLTTENKAFFLQALIKE
jgi:hypothetical protein